MNNIVKADVPAAEAKPAKPFKGFTMEELKYQRALMALRKEFAKEQIQNSVQALRPNRQKDGQSKFANRFGLAATVAKKLLGNLNSLDYLMVGMSAFGVAKKAYNLFRKKK